MDTLRQFRGNLTPTGELYFTYKPAFIWSTLAIYTLFTVIGISSNVLVILVIALHKHLRTLPNVFITQLATGDIVILVFCMPFTVSSEYFFKYWPFGEFWCYVVKTAGCMGASVSILTLAVMSYERYRVIVSPLTSRELWGTGQVAFICISIYLVSFGRGIIRPIYGGQFKLIYNNFTAGMEPQCYDDIGTTFVIYYHIIGSVIFYFGIAIFICILNWRIARQLTTNKFQELSRSGPRVMRQRKSLAHMLFSVVIGFMLLWLMAYSVNITFVFREHRHFSGENWYAVYVFLARTLEYVSCSFNPFIYMSMCANFRRAASKMMCRFCVSGATTPDKYSTSSSAATVSASLNSERNAIA